MRSAELGIVVVMVIVGTLPDRHRAEGQHSEDPHEPFSSAGMTKDGVVLLIVIDNEHPQKQKAGENAASDFAKDVKIPKCAGDGRAQERGGRERQPPASRR